MNCRPTSSPYLNELHSAHSAQSINGCWPLYFLQLTVMKHKMWQYFHHITPGAITEAALPIAHLLSMEHIQPTFAFSACGHEGLSMCFRPKTPTSRLQLSNLWREYGGLCGFQTVSNRRLQAKETELFRAGRPGLCFLAHRIWLEFCLYHSFISDFLLTWHSVIWKWSFVMLFFQTQGTKRWMLHTHLQPGSVNYLRNQQSFEEVTRD